MTRMSTATHGTIDYVVSGMIAAMPKLFGFSKKVTAILEGSAGMSAMYSAMTNYERGLIKVLPMKAHLTLDALSGGALLGAALMLKDEDPEARAALAGIGLFEIAAALTTETHSTTEDRKQRRHIGGRSRKSRAIRRVPRHA